MCRITKRCVFDRVDDCVLSVAFCHRSGWAKGCQKGESGAVRVGWSNCKKVQFGLVTLIWILRYCAKDDSKSHQLHLFDEKTRVPCESGAVRVGWSNCTKVQFGLVKSERLLVWQQQGLIWFGLVLLVCYDHWSMAKLASAGPYRDFPQSHPLEAPKKWMRMQAHPAKDFANGKISSG